MSKKRFGGSLTMVDIAAATARGKEVMEAANVWSDSAREASALARHHGLAEANHYAHQAHLKSEEALRHSVSGNHALAMKAHYEAGKLHSQASQSFAKAGDNSNSGVQANHATERINHAASHEAELKQQVAQHWSQGKSQAEIEDKLGVKMNMGGNLGSHHADMVHGNFKFE